MEAPAGPSRVTIPEQLQVRFPDEKLRELLEAFCSKTDLGGPEACRQLMWLSLRGGIEKAAAALLSRDDSATSGVSIPRDRLLELLHEAFELSGYTPSKASGVLSNRKKK